MSTTTMKARVTSFAPQFLVDDLDRSIAYYHKLGFRFGEPWAGFYAIGHLDALEVHLKEAPKNQAERRWRRENEHLDASAGVDGIEAEPLAIGELVSSGTLTTSLVIAPGETWSAEVEGIGLSSLTLRLLG